MQEIAQPASAGGPPANAQAAAPASDPVSNSPGGSPPPAGGPVGHSPLGTPSGSPEQAEALATELSHDLMSPYCPGRTIATCPSPNARKLESLILDQAKAGRSRAEIETSLVQQFPDIRGYVGRPEIIWGTAVVALIAIVGLVLAGRRWVRHGRQPAMAIGAGAGAAAAVMAAPESPASKVPTEPVVAAQAAASPAAGQASRRELDALDDALDRIDEF